MSHSDELTGAYRIDASRIFADTEQRCRLCSGKTDRAGSTEHEAPRPVPRTWPTLTYAKSQAPSTWVDSLMPDRQASRVRYKVGLDAAIH